MTDAWKQQEGQIVGGRFRLIQYLGGTDHSAVFLTESGDNRERAAIKLIGADAAEADSQLARLRRAAKLSHPHLARILETGRAQVGSANVLYVVTEYAEEDLAQILPDRALTPEEVREMLPFIIDALQHLHAQGLVHARLKPSNILAVNDQLKLSTDGVCAKGERGVPGEQSTAYDPPELAPEGPSPAGDVWSLGMTIVEVLTRRLPVWEWTGHADPPAPRTLPAPFLEIARNSLRRDPAMRCTLREISENLDPQAAPRVATPRSAAASPSISSGVAVSMPAAVPASRTGTMPHQEAAQQKSNSRYLVRGLAFVFALAVVIAIPRLFRTAPRPFDSDPVSASAPATEAPKSDEVAATPPSKANDAVSHAAKGSSSAAAAPAATAPSSPAAAANRSASATLHTEPPKAIVPAKSSAPSAVRGQVVQKVVPEVSQKARDTIQGKVRVSVKVTVDPSGKVTAAALDSAGPSKYFADAALRAARSWTFAPAKSGGQVVASDWLLRFEFAPDATDVFSAELNP
jgi:TonB family protein